MKHTKHKQDPTDVHAELSPLVDAAYALVCRGWDIATEGLNGNNNEKYRSGVALMDVGRAAICSVNETAARLK